MGAFTDITVFSTTLVTSAMLSGIAVEGGSEEFEFKDVDSLPPPPPQDKHSRIATQTNTESPQR
jgi:hypothetical protein